jgi:hypothetical protein
VYPVVSKSPDDKPGAQLFPRFAGLSSVSRPGLEPGT